MADRDSLIEGYFHMGLAYNEMIHCLQLNNGITASSRYHFHFHLMCMRRMLELKHFKYESLKKVLIQES